MGCICIFWVALNNFVIWFLPMGWDTFWQNIFECFNLELNHCPLLVTCQLISLYPILCIFSKPLDIFKIIVICYGT